MTKTQSNSQSILYQTDSPTLGLFARERSSSNRNLPDASKLRVQPRRASDEVAGSSSHRLSAKVSPAASRRSISVMNVYGDNQLGLLSRPGSRLGSQSNVLRGQPRKNSSSQLAQQPACSTSPGGDPQHQTPVGTTASGRRSSLVGIKSMAGYRSQKSSQSDATDQDSPRSSVQRRSQPCTPQQSRLMGPSCMHQPLAASESDSITKSAQKSRGSTSVTTPPTGNASPNFGGSRPDSRRGSGEQASSIQRRGSLVATTLRKLKRTMSISKNDQDIDGNQDGRRESESSYESVSLNVQEDLAISRRVSARTGKLIRAQVGLARLHANN